MSIGKPKLDDLTQKAINRLQSNPDFQHLVRHQQALSDYYRECLITASPSDVPMLQGRAQELGDYLKLVKRPTP